MLRTIEVAVGPNATSVAVPALAKGESLVSASIVNIIARSAAEEQMPARSREEQVAGR